MKVSELTPKNNAFEVTDPNTQVSAEEYNAIITELKKVPEVTNDIFFEKPELLLCRGFYQDLVNGLVVRHPYLNKDEECEVVLMRYANNRITEIDLNGRRKTRGRKRGWVEAKPQAEAYQNPPLIFGPFSNRNGESVVLDIDTIKQHISLYLHSRSVGENEVMRFAKNTQRMMFGIALRRANKRYGGVAERESQMWSMGQYRYEYSQVAKLLAHFTGDVERELGLSIQ